MRKIIIVGYLGLLSQSALGLVPVEGILLGEANGDYQQDPLSYVFSDIYDKSKQGENNKIKLYLETFLSGDELNRSCERLGPYQFESSWKEKQALRSTVATLQFIGLDTTIKAIGAYARKLSIESDKFKDLSKSLTQNFCSKNVSVIALKSIEKSLQYYYDNPIDNFIPSVQSSPFATQVYKQKSESMDARTKEFNQIIKNFRAFCSWGGDTQDYRMLPPYLNNRYIMSFVFNNMLGVQKKVNKKTSKVEFLKSSNTVQVFCNDLICRKTTVDEILSKFPKSVGSTGLETDLIKMYCHHFRFVDYNPKKSIPNVQTWIKAQELESPIFETNTFISLMTGVPDLFFSAKEYKEVPILVKSSIDERWEMWAKTSLSQFSKDLFYEESLKVKLIPQNKNVANDDRFELGFMISLGEMDRIVNSNDKLSSIIKIKLSKNYLRLLRNRWDYLSREIDLDGQEKFKQEMSQFIDHQLKEKEKLFIQKVWNKDFSRLVFEELLLQAINYKASYFEKYDDEMLEIPIKFSYGVFALNYLKVRSDAQKSRPSFN